jgi:hypothetical protein
VTRSQVLALLDGDLVPTGRGAAIGALRSRGAYAFAFRAPEAGAVTFDWYAKTPAGHAARAKPKPTLVASGRASFTGARDLKLTVKLTAAGRRLLAHATRLALTADATFTPAGAVPIRVTRSIELRP